MTTYVALPVETITLPLLPLPDEVAFPQLGIVLIVGRPKSAKAIEAAMELDGHIVLVAQKSSEQDQPTDKDLYRVGCIARIVQTGKTPDGSARVVLDGIARARIEQVGDLGELLVAAAVAVPPEVKDGAAAEALRRTVIALFEEYAEVSGKVAAGVPASVAAMEDAGRLADTVASHMALKLEQKQELLEIFDVTARLEKLVAKLENEIGILQVQKSIRGRVRQQMDKNQREYYLNEQVKAIQRELGEGEEADDLAGLEHQVLAAGMPRATRDKALAEIRKLRLMSPSSSEAVVARKYVATLIELPWKKKTRICKDLAAAEQVLEKEHFGLDKVKERILEYLAVQQRVDKVKAPILCLVGPPGVGKTSLGQSIARATNRKFVRLSLGGVRDEAEIRGHRRTYIGSMPGRILQGMAKVGVKNPLFLLDEVDKMGMDLRGDPASALLEVLDPEQNGSFTDHYAEVEYDLSNVMFVATANSLRLPAPLLDRMEVIRISGYTEEEKLKIAQRYLVPRQMANNGLKKDELTLSTDALRGIVRHYTREAGVRGLEREISKICRKVVKSLVLRERQGKRAVNAKNLDKFLGVPRFGFGRAEKENQIGQVCGLAWTEVGGELLSIEAVALPGKGKVTTTGKLGDVMRESIQAALSVVRKHSRMLGIGEDFHQHRDIHIHLPEGATPKDGPSAGIAIATALVSILTGIAVRADVAMTGEITLRGEVLPIGGLKEKLLAAHRGGVRLAIIPEDNVKDLLDIPDNIKNALEIVPVKWIDRVLELALERSLKPLPDADEAPLFAGMAEIPSDPVLAH